VLTKTIDSSPDAATLMTYACCCLHNWLLAEKDADYARLEPKHRPPPPPVQQGKKHLSQHTSMDGIERTGSNNHTKAAVNVRDRLVDYFNREGALDWQLDRVASGLY